MRKLALIVAILVSTVSYSQKIVDEIIGVVGSEPIFLSEVEEQAQQDFMNGTGTRDAVSKCNLFEELLFQKMLLDQASKDSLDVGDDQVENEMDRRMAYFVLQAGGEKELETYLGMTIPEIKKNFRENIRKQLLIQQMQQKIISRVKITPNEVKNFYKQIPKDSLPLVPSEVEYAQIVIRPKPTSAEIQAARQKAQKIRDDIVRGSSFCLKAKLESEDLGSAQNCGELGFLRREDLVPEFSAAAFRLKTSSEISEVVETEFGFHIIQLIEKRGELANFRHILIRPKTNDVELQKAAKILDSLNLVLKTDSTQFANLAQKFSTDLETRYNGGKVVNPRTGNTRFREEELDPYARVEIMQLNPGQFSEPHLFQLQTGETGFRIIMLLNRTQPHVADLKNDYQIIEEAAIADKQADAIAKWIEKKQDEIYIRISDNYKSCEFRNTWKVLNN